MTTTDLYSFVGYQVGRLTFLADEGDREAGRALRHLRLLRLRLRTLPPERAVEPLRGINHPVIRQVLEFAVAVIGEAGTLSVR